ncbi:MAG: hypothetical protein HGB11_03860, partial [Chlorobiales bacterium]|nr:hypothetical protein [Chlorobiales bacterium]
MADQEKPTGGTPGGGGGAPKKPPLQAAKLQAAKKAGAPAASPAAAAAPKSAPAAEKAPAPQKAPAPASAAPKPKPAAGKSGAEVPPVMEASVADMKRFLLKRSETRTTKWFQVFDADKLDDEQVVGAHLALLGTLGIVMAIYYISGIQVFPWGSAGFHDNWFYL